MVALDWISLSSGPQKNVMGRDLFLTIHGSHYAILQIGLCRKGKGPATIHNTLLKGSYSGHVFLCHMLNVWGY